MIPIGTLITGNPDYPTTLSSFPERRVGVILGCGDFDTFSTIYKILFLDGVHMELEGFVRNYYEVHE